MQKITFIPLFGDEGSWLSGNRHLFHSEQSLRWFLKRNDLRLIQADALVLIRAQWHVVEPKFSQALAEIFKSEALRAVGEPA